MKFSKEIKVGLAIVIAVVAFVLGIRFFKDVPLFTGTYGVYTEVEDAKGLIPGNPVRVNGVKVGSISTVDYNQERNLVHVSFRVNNDIAMPEGTTATLTGIDALTGVRIELNLGPPSNPNIEPGGLVPAVSNGADFASRLMDRAPVIADRVDSVLVGLEGTIVNVRGMLGEPDSDLRRSMAALRGTAVTLNELLREEKATISSILANVDTVATDLSAITSQHGDSIAVAVTRLNSALATMEVTMKSLESTTSQLDRVLARIDNGEGTLGKLINEPDLYHRLDSLVTSIDALVVDFKANPRRYLREMKIVDLF